MKDHPPGPRRTLEIEEPTNRYVIHPVSRACVEAFARWGVSPNAVSLAGMALGAGAAAAYARFHSGPAAVLGFALMLGWHVMDGADGQLARLTGQTSALGEVLDGVCDYVTFVLVYVALALTAGGGAWAWGAAVLAGLSHATQASAYEYQRQAYNFWGHGKGEAPHERSSGLPRGAGAGVARVFGALHRGYLRLQRRVAGGSAPLHRALEAVLRHAHGESEQQRVRARYREAQAAGVRRWALLCSNYRTGAIFLFCLAGVPALFFAFEILVLNAVFAWLMRQQRRRNRSLRAALRERTRAAPRASGEDADAPEEAPIRL